MGAKSQDFQAKAVERSTERRKTENTEYPVMCSNQTA